MKTILVMILVLALGLATPCNFAFSHSPSGGSKSGAKGGKGGRKSPSAGARFTKDDLKDVKGSGTSTSRPGGSRTGWMR